MEVCQDGIEGVLPSWCVKLDTGPETWIQLAFELLISIILFFMLYYFFVWRRKIKKSKKKDTKSV